MRVGWILAVALLTPGLAAALPVAGHADGWWTRSFLDADHDGVDDALVPLLHGDSALRVLVDYDSMPTGQDRADLERAGFLVVRSYQNFPILVADGLPGHVRDALRLPHVVMIEKNDVVVPLLKDSVPLIGAPQAWQQYGVTGKGITVAVLDDGIFEQHPDLKDKIAGDYDASGTTNPIAGKLPGGLVTPAAGSEGHGTHVAGTIAGPGTQSGGVYRGVAPDASIVNVKVFSDANSTSSEIVLGGLDWCLTNAGPLHIRIASMSLGGRASDGTDAISRGVDIAVDKGMVVVAAAGNTGPDPMTITSPGAAAKAITVGAVDKRKNIAPFSSRGPTLGGAIKPDIAAPGVDITSTIPPQQVKVGGFLSSRQDALFYGALSGTSMATPHVSGVAALMLEANPKLSAPDVKKILLVTAQDLGAKGVDNETGFGFLNAIAAVQVAKDPTLLSQPEFQSRLAQVPNPPPEGFLDRLSYEAQSAAREGKLPLYSSIAAGIVLALIVVPIAIVKVARRKP